MLLLFRFLIPTCLLTMALSSDKNCKMLGSLLVAFHLSIFGSLAQSSDNGLSSTLIPEMSSDVAGSLMFSFGSLCLSSISLSSISSVIISIEAGMLMQLWKHKEDSWRWHKERNSCTSFTSNMTPTTYRPLTDHIPTTYRPHTDHIPTTYRPHTDHIPTTYRPLTDHFFTAQLVQYYQVNICPLIKVEGPCQPLPCFCLHSRLFHNLLEISTKQPLITKRNS